MEFKNAQLYCDVCMTHSTSTAPKMKPNEILFVVFVIVVLLKVERLLLDPERIFLFAVSRNLMPKCLAHLEIFPDRSDFIL